MADQVRSDYFFLLNEACKLRYLSKLSLINNEDPYLPGVGFSEDVSLLPRLSYPDLVNYLLYTTSFVTKEVTNYKSLESYKYFLAGWVQQKNWKTYSDGDVILIRGKVKHSYRVSLPPLQPWVVVQKNGTVVCGHCTCMAGLAETCSHVGAVVYWTETAVRIPDEATCTSKKNTWIMPSPVNDVPFLRLKDIRSDSQQKLDHDQQSSKPHQYAASAEELSAFYAELSHCAKKPIILSVVAPNNGKFVQSIDHLPRSLQTLYDPPHLELNFTQLLELAQQFKEEVTLAMRDHLEDITRTQSLSKMWFKYHAGRVTASKLHAVVHTNPHQPSISLLKCICYPEINSFKSASTEWGCSHEKDALELYKSTMQRDHTDFKISLCGFFISIDEPHLGASPDSIVFCACHGMGIVEVKCPYCARDMALTDAADSHSSHSCLEHLPDGGLRLKPAHAYYYQCQLQLHVTQYSYCDFVVWTKQSVHIERMHFDDALLEKCLPAAKYFFEHCILPELLSKWYSRQHSIAVPTIDTDSRPADDDDGSWCYCKEDHAGEMIACM